VYAPKPFTSWNQKIPTNPPPLLLGLLLIPLIPPPIVIQKGQPLVHPSLVLPNSEDHLLDDPLNLQVVKEPLFDKRSISPSHKKISQTLSNEVHQDPLITSPNKEIHLSTNPLLPTNHSLLFFPLLHPLLLLLALSNIKIFGQQRSKTSLLTSLNLYPLTNNERLPLVP
jgi:hypothetical protein